MLKVLKNTQTKREARQYKLSHGINQKARQSKSNAGTTALERSVV